jgi:RNA polymerase sigma-70 factor (ECF subfamily)
MNARPLAVPPNLAPFRAYLKLLAKVQLSPRWRGKEDASDIVQFALLMAQRNWPAYRGSTDEELLAWLRIIFLRNILYLAKHECLI